MDAEELTKKISETISHQILTGYNIPVGFKNSDGEEVEIRGFDLITSVSEDGTSYKLVLY